MESERRTLFSVIEVTLPNGAKEIELDWHGDLYPALDELSPNGEITDKVIDIAQELLHAFDDDEDDPEFECGAASNGERGNP